VKALHPPVPERRYRWEVQVSTQHKGLIAYDGLYAKRHAIREAEAYELQPGERIKVVNVVNGRTVLDRNPLYLLTTDSVRQRYIETLKA
jgi:hypothetical protein